MRNIFYKVIISTICFGILLSLFSVFSISSYAYEYEDDYGKECYDIMNGIGIINESFGVYNPDRIVTRAEFIKMAWIVANQPIISSSRNAFTDITEDSSYYDYVMSAYERGIVSGSGNGVFQPDSQITLNQALTIITKLLGYGEIAANNGGFPYGYIKIAESCRITYRILMNSDNSMNMSTSVALLYNMLNAPLLKMVSVGTYAVSGDNENQTMLANQYHIYKHSGILTTDAYTDIISPVSDLPINKIRIETIVFEDLKNYADKYLGYNVDVFYYAEDKDAREKSALYITGNKKNTVYSAYSGNIEGTGNSFELYDGDNNRIKKLSIKNMTPFIINGRMKSVTFADLHAIEKGVFEFISNDGDGDIDIVKVYDFKTYVISGVSPSMGLLQTEDGQRIELDLESSDYNFSIVKNDKKISLDEIKIGDLILFAEITGSSLNKKTIVVCDEKLIGEVSQTTEKGIKVDGYDYDTTDSIKSKIRVGRSYEFLLDSFGNIVHVSTTDSAVYGYLDTIRYKRDQVKCRIFTENGRWVELCLAEKVTFNNIRKRDTDVFNDITTASANVRQLIRYRVNENGEIRFLETAELVKIDSSGEKSAIEDNKFRISYQEGTLNYRSGQKTFDGKFFLTNSTKIFYIPTSYDSSLYRIKTAVSFIADQPYTVQAYDVDESLNAGAVLLHNMIDEPIESIMVVRGKGTMLDSDDLPVPSLIVYSYGSKLTLPVNEETAGTVYNSLQEGDYIAISMNDAGLLDSITKYSFASDKYYLSGNIYHKRTMIAGIIKENDVSCNRIRLVYNEKGDSCGIGYNKNTAVYIYNKNEKTYIPATVTDILEGDTVFIGMNYLTGKEVLIIRN